MEQEINNSTQSKRFTVLSGMHRGASTVCPTTFSLGGMGGEDIHLKDEYFRDKTIIFQQSSDSEYGFELTLGEEQQAMDIEIAVHDGRSYFKAQDVIWVISDEQDDIEDAQTDTLNFSAYTIEEKPEQTSDQPPASEEHNEEQTTDETDASQQTPEQPEPDQTLEPNTDAPDEVDEYQAHIDEKVQALKESNPQHATDDVAEHGTQSEHTPPKNQWIHRFAIMSLLGVSVLLGAIIGKIYLDRKSLSDTTETVGIDCRSNLQDGIQTLLGYPLTIIKTQPTTQATNEHQGDPVFIVSGTVETRDLIEPLVRSISETGCQVEWRLTALDDTVAELKQFVLARHSNAVSVSTSVLHNLITVEGFVPTEREWNYTKQTLLTMLDNKVDLQDRVRFTSHVQTFITNQLAETNLAGYVLLTLSQSRLVVANMVFQPDLLRKWEFIHENYKARFPHAPDIEVKEINLGQLGIRAVAMNTPPRVVLSNGQTYMIGSIFPNGAVLTGVAPDAITLQTPKGMIKYPVFQSAMQRNLGTNSGHQQKTRGNHSISTPEPADETRPSTTRSKDISWSQTKKQQLNKQLFNP